MNIEARLRIEILRKYPPKDGDQFLKIEYRLFNPLTKQYSPSLYTRLRRDISDDLAEHTIASDHY